MNAPMNTPHTIPAADIVIRDTVIPEPVGPARPRARHGLVLASFCAMVLAPVLVSAWYLWTRAADQYASHVGFSVRTEEVGSAIELLGGVTELSGSSSSDADILYKFLHSQELVAAVDANLDLRSIWTQENPIKDPVFTYHPPGTIEDLLSHWNRMVAVAYDSGSGLIDLRVLAFTPEDAQAIAQDIFARSSAMINALSALAREDAIGYAQAELAQAEARLSAAQTELSAFRHRTQIVDPSIDAQGQMGLLTNLQAQLAAALIELDLLRETTRADDARVVQGARRIAVIEARIAEERHKLGFGSRAGASGATGDWQGRVFADLVGEYEALILELEFARESYTAARAAFEAARNEARRQSRYLAAHVRPTRAERAEYPRRALLLAGIALLSGIGWAITVLVGYALRDRR
ncbi:MAG: capsule biosynthesis protein [Dinoroseobacter sp.]|nr:capsule biosynthesis protein [Dinoroseobacter sp.]